MNFKIIYTNDIHSNFKRYAKISTVIKEYKNENVFILDAGDFVDFKSIEYQGTNGLAAIELLEEVNYDAITIGNNEMFKKIETLENMTTNSNVPFLSCNLLKDNNEEISEVKKSIIINKNELKLLIIGTSPCIKEFNKLLGFNTDDYIGAIKKEIDKQEGKYDVCLLLNHIGSEKDVELAKLINGIDIIISAHDHKLFDEPIIVNNTIITSTGSFGKNVGILDLENSNNKVILKSSKMVRIQDQHNDKNITRIINRNKEKAREKLSKPLYSINRELWHDVIEENPISNLIADALKDMFECDIGLINSGIVNGGIINPVVTELKILEICPSPLSPTFIELQGKDLLIALESSLDPDVCMDNGGGSGFRGKNLGRLHVSGASIKYNLNKIRSILINGEVINNEKWYKVATSDYLQRGTGYPSLGNNRNERYIAIQIKDLLREYTNKKHFVERAMDNRWKEIN